jgi:hypothetical protein
MSSLQDAIKEADRRLVKSWDALNCGGFNNMSTNISQRCSDQSSVENEESIAMQTKEDSDAAFPFKMWAEIIPPERISRWSAEDSRTNECVSSQRRSAHQAVKENVLEELCQLLVRRASVSIGTGKR